MNDKIKTLMHRSGIRTTDYGSGEFFAEDDISLDQFEKFAELIVKECARVPINMWDQAELNADIAVKIEDRIRAEFGIPGVRI